MSRQLVLPALALALLLPAPPALAGTPVVVDREATQQQLTQASLRLAQIRASVTTAPMPKDWIQWAQTELRVVEGQLEDLKRQLKAAPGSASPPCVTVEKAKVPGAPGAPGAPPQRPPIDAKALATLIERITAEPFSPGRLRLVQDAARTDFFLVEQVAKILPLYQFEIDRVKALEQLAPRIVDKPNAAKLGALFSFEPNKAKVQKILAKP